MHLYIVALFTNSRCMDTVRKIVCREEENDEDEDDVDDDDIQMY